MKKFKLFALAIMAMLSTNAFADTNAKAGQFNVSYSGTLGADTELTITGLEVNVDAANITSIAIPATLKLDGVATGLKVTGIAANAFSTCPKLATVDFSAATNITTIGAGAFKGTVITSLDLSKTQLAVVTNIFGTNLAYTAAETSAAALDAVANDKIASITLPETWTKIEATQIGTTTNYIGAFENCTALTTVNFGTAKTGTAEGAQTIEQKAFLGTKVATFNVANTKLTALAANLFADGTKVATNATLTTVTLRAEGKITNFKNAFNYCTGLTGIDLTGVTTLNANEFKGCAGLTSILIPNTVSVIPAGVFENCTKLAEVTFAHTTQAFTGIGATAFGKTAIASITIPATLPLNVVANAATPTGVASTAFYGCEKLKSFTYNPVGDVSAKVIDDLAFVGCEGVVITTSASYISFNPTAPTNASYGTSSGDAAAVTFTPKQYKSNSSKYYICYKAPSVIKIKKGDAKVYQAYLDATNGDINMIQYRAKGGYYTIAANAVVLILTEKSDLAYEAGTAADAGNWLTREYANGATTDANFQIANDNALQLVTATDGTARADLELRIASLPAALTGYKLFGWVNLASGVGFQQITSGTTFPLQSMYVFAKPSSASGRLNINWLDEDGNIEEQTTAIQTVKKVAEDGALYNLAGQKVNAAYKGVVIKDGKKFIQK